MDAIYSTTLDIAITARKGRLGSGVCVKKHITYTLPTREAGSMYWLSAKQTAGKDVVPGVDLTSPSPPKGAG